MKNTGRAEPVSGRDDIQARFAQAHQATNDEVRIVDGLPCSPDNPLACHDVERRTARRGVQLRRIVDTKILEGDDQWADRIRFGLAHRERARVISETPLQMTLFDERMAILALDNPDNDDDSALIIHHPSTLFRSLSAMFELLWRVASPLRLDDVDPVHPSTSEPSIDERLLLDLLTAGLTDRTIARCLNVSHRTLQRRVHSLFKRLAARTRFQAGLRASTLGWVASDCSERPRRGEAD